MRYSEITGQPASEVLRSRVQLDRCYRSWREHVICTVTHDSAEEKHPQAFPKVVCLLATRQVSCPNLNQGIPMLRNALLFFSVCNLTLAWPFSAVIRATEAGNSVSVQ